MFPSGVLVRVKMDDLVSSLPDRLVSCGPPGLKASVVEGDPDPDVRGTLELNQWSDFWCHLKVDGTDELSTLLVESLVKIQPVKELVTCRFVPESGEYSYAYFRNGELLESFECSGPSMETINFTSELRKVPIQNILRASEFMAASMEQFGIEPEPKHKARLGDAVIQVDFPGRKTFWQTLLGAVSRR